MKTFDERMDSIRRKGQAQRKVYRNRRILAGTLTGMFVVALALVLFVPYSTALPDVSRYSGSPYYHVIQSLNKASYTPPRYKNNFDYLTSIGLTFDNAVNAPGAEGNISNSMVGDGLNWGEWLPDMDEEVKEPMDPPSNSYEEVTDNQVQGVIEGDLFKRSDKYLFYLHDSVLMVYSIQQEESALVGRHEIVLYDDFGKAYCTEMYLSQDCTTVTLVMDGYNRQTGASVILVSLDVSDPANIQQNQWVQFTGSPISTRMVNGDLLLTYNYGVSKSEMYFDVPETYIPSYGTPGNMQLISGEDIICPEDAGAIRYTVVARLDGATLAVEDTTALLSYSQQLYVSQDTIYATHSYTKKTDQQMNTYLSTSMTEITGISYAGEGLEVLGTIQIEGSVKDQYSMDQYEGILRVAASTNRQIIKEYNNGMYASVGVDSQERNCSLYCIDIASWNVVASVENFAPAGEEVTSARFDGDEAYICTAEVIILSDPVFFFDLSDLDNIQWTDTGIIDGYSSSLVNFGDFLLGIGFGAERELKLEAYAQGQEGVESLAIFERYATFPSQYKAYLIDRGNNRIGLPIMDWNTGEAMYLLLQFDGYKFRQLASVSLQSYMGDNTRAVVIEDYLYILNGDEFLVKQV